VNTTTLEDERGKAMATGPAKDLGLKIDANRLQFADVLRFFGAIAVVFQHTFELSGIKFLNDLTLLLGPGIFGVALFFFISGFVIPFSVRRGIDLRDFAIRRIFRIYPLVIVAFLLWFVSASLGIIHDDRLYQIDLPTFMANIFFYHNFTGAISILGVTWTLSLEFLWYAMFAVTLVVFGKRTGFVMEIVPPLVIIVGMVAAILSGHRIPIGYFGLIYCAAIGYQAFLMFEGTLRPRRFWTSAIIMVVIMAIGNVVSYGYFHHERTTLAASIVPWMLAPLVFFAAQIPSVRSLPVFRNRTLSTLGAISFSTYMLHPLALAFCKRFTSGGIWVACSILLALAMSFVGYRWVERPGIELGRRLARRFSTGKATRDHSIILDPSG